MKPLTVGSLFSGIGGIDLGLERAGMQVLWQVECDPYARKVLAKNFPRVICFPDIRELHALEKCPHGGFCGSCLWSHVDVLAGGFPCQDISVAGKGKGIKDGTRSGLWSEFARLIRELRPRYVLVENVPALRSRGLDRVLGDLAACGYDAEWDGLSAAALGAPHRRDRLFLVAYPQREFVRKQSGGGHQVEPVLSGTPFRAWRSSGHGRTWPTPTARDWKSGASNMTNARPLNEVVHKETPGPLNPTFVEWLMGFPLGWTDLGASGTPSSPKPPNSSAG